MTWQPYPAYSRTGRLWLGLLPRHWGLKRIKHTTYVKGRIGWQGLRSDEFCDQGPFLVTGTDFGDGRINWDSCYHVSEDRYEEDPHIQLGEGDLLITKDGTIGKVAVVREMPGKATLNSGIFVARPTSDDYTTEFLYWVLNSAVFTGFIDYNKAGSTISHLYQNVFVEFAFPVPTLQEQRAIAAFLDRETERIDALIAKKERQIELLQEKRAAIISHAVTKGLDPSAPMRDSGVEWLGKIPAHWSLVPLRFVVLPRAPAVKTGPFGSQLQSSEMLSGTVKVYNQRNVLDRDFRSGENYITDEKYAELHAFAVYPGDLLVTTRGTIGHCAQVPADAEPGVLHPCLMRVQPDPDKVLPQYLATLIQDSDLVRTQLSLMSNATTIDVIYSESLKRVRLPVPAKAEQGAILSRITFETEILRGLLAKVEHSIATLHEYRTALISAAVTGKIDVRQEVS